VPDPEDAAGFARAIEALRDPAARGALAARARPVAEGLGGAAHAEALLALYERVLEGKAAA